MFGFNRLSLILFSAINKYVDDIDTANSGLALIELRSSSDISTVIISGGVSETDPLVRVKFDPLAAADKSVRPLNTTLLSMPSSQVRTSVPSSMSSVKLSKLGGFKSAVCWLTGIAMLVGIASSEFVFKSITAPALMAR